MKIALLTIWHEKNYGAELQAYATIKVLQQLGHDVEMIDIRLSDCAKFNIKGRIGNFLSKFGPSHHKFCSFWKKYIPTTRRYKTLSSLQKNPPIADIYMVGSDQVWNPMLTKDFATLYFLNFGGIGVKRISYASSFGTPEWKFPELKNEITNLLRRFSSVTCRERSGVEILKREFNINAFNVIDPTLLLGDYSDLIGSISEKNTLVYYPLSSDPELENFSKKIAKEIGLIPINNKFYTTILSTVEWDRISISEWVKNIAEAKFVLTRSFHGMVFAIMHNRQFAVLAGADGRGTRLKNLLQQIGLENRFYTNIHDLEIAKPWDKQIDYKRINPLILKLRKESLEILMNSIER